MTIRWAWAGGVLFICLIIASAEKNKVSKIESSCSEDVVNVTLWFENIFSGVVYSKGSDCLHLKSEKREKWIHLSLNPKECALRITKENGMLMYTGSLQVQMSETVQQATDPILKVKCSLDTEMLKITAKTRRTGRMVGEIDENTGKAWLEVRGSAISAYSPTNTLSVGEHTTLSVFTELPDDISSKPVECKVSDGRGEVQTLSDEKGCSTDPGLVPALRQIKKYHWATAFPAFSFPDTQLVRYTCMLMLCSGDCPEEDNILDYVELYNSVEVTAPNIELGYLRKDSPELLSQGTESEGWICLSGPRVAIVFATLGALFVIAVLATLLLLIRKKRKHTHRNHYGLYS